MENPLEGTSAVGQLDHWSGSGDFESDVGDIKGVWELSRFQYLLDKSWRIATDNPSHIQLWLDQSRAMLDSWCKANPPNRGPNWKCAQEASIRVLHTTFASQLCDSANVELADSTSWVTFLVPHLRRILPTTHYARAQDNNHGTSEAVALYVGGLLLRKFANNDAHLKLSSRCLKIGRNMLVERASTLIAVDGTFSQYSVVYHRMMLDSLVYAELNRRRFNDPEFPQPFYSSARNAVIWLLDLVDYKSNDSPNIGANDGAHLFNAAGLSYRNFSESANVAAQVFLGEKKKEHAGVESKHAFWIGFKNELNGVRKVGTVSSNGPASATDAPCSFVRLGNRRNWGVLRIPGYRFRPSQADVLHFDCWADGVNICRDSGTYAYNLKPEELDEFAGTAAHNTICFDGRNQMPRLSRFLFGQWLNSKELDIDREAGVVRCSYDGNYGEFHKRTVAWLGSEWCVEDTVGGKFEIATLRWRLCPTDWNVEGNAVVSTVARITIDIDDRPIVPKLESVRESRYYRQMTEIPCVVASVSNPCTIKTRIIVPDASTR